MKNWNWSSISFIRLKPFPENHKMRYAALNYLFAGVLIFSGCTGERLQSALHPAAPEAQQIARLWWVMFCVCSFIFVVVIGLLFWGIFAPRKPQSSPPGGSTGFVVAGGIIMPAIVLTGFLIYSLKVVVSQRPDQAAETIRVTGFQWWWDVHYPVSGVRTANEIYIPAGRKVRLELIAADVVHSLWIPNLHGKIDLLPEKTNVWHIRADRPGIYRGQCAEFCGLQHALMAIYVVALPEDQYERWKAQRQEPPLTPANSELQKGQRAFFAYGCNNCHAIRGTGATARVGPDLTHIGSRLSLGAGTLTNTVGTLGGWIGNPQVLKPGNHMPATLLPPDDLHALVAYLRSLE